MFAASFNAWWGTRVYDDAAPEPPKKRPTPIFVGDAVHPWAGETMLLSILRRDAERAEKDD